MRPPLGSLDGARRLLLIKPSALGDVVHALPVAATLKQRYPDLELDWLVEEEAAGIVEGHPALTQVLVSGRRRWQRQMARLQGLPALMGEVRGLVRTLRSRRYDLVVDLQGLFKSSLYVLAAGAPVRVGLADGREGAPLVLTHRIAGPPQPVHAARRYMALAEALGAPKPVWDFQIPVRPADETRAAAVLAGLPHPRVVLHPGARWRTKLWQIDDWRALAAALAGEGVGVLLTGGREDGSLSEAILAGLEPAPRALVGRLSLKELAAVLARTDVMVTVDSGPMHMAAAMGTPVVALFGATDPRRTGPWGDAVILRRDLACSPCLQRRCAIAERYRCMRELTVPDTLAAVRQVLGAARGRASDVRGPGPDGARA